MSGAVAILARAEWQRLRANRVLWLFTGALLVLGIALYLADAMAHAAPLTDPGVPPEFVRQRELLRMRDAFPQSVITYLDDGMLVAWGTAILACVLVGAEFSWGTIRHAVGAPGGLPGLAVSRVVSLGAFAAAVLMGLAGLGCIAPTLLALAIELPEAPAISATGTLAYAAAWLLVCLVCGAVGSLLTGLTRSAALGIVASFVYINAESFIALRPEAAPDGYATGIGLLLPVQSALALVRSTAALAGRVDPSSAFHGEVFASSTGNAAVPIAWLLVFALCAALALRCRDVRE